MHISLADNPYAKLSSGIVTEIDETRDITESRPRRKAGDIVPRKRIHEFFMGANDLC